MNKRLFFLLVVLMSLSLIGIIFVQGYWIKSTVDDKEEQFSYNAKQVLINVSKELQNKELEAFWFNFDFEDSTALKLNSDNLEQYFGLNEYGENGNQDYNKILETNHKESSDFLVSTSDSIELAKLINNRVNDFLNKDKVSGSISAEERLDRLMRMEEVEKDMLSAYISEFTSKIPIHKRLSKQLIEKSLKEELQNYNLKSGFEYGVYANSLATKVHSDNFSMVPHQPIRFHCF
jgi:two-component system phosphate regulon sensor histidine kinase PhoR